MKNTWNQDKKGTYQKGKAHPNWKGGISKAPDYEKKRYTGKRKELITKRNRKRTKDQMKNEFIKSKYGIDLEEYCNMLKSQKGVCAICGEEEKRKSRYGGVCKLTIDHSHKNGKVRGLLCSRCNNGLGQFRDNLLLLKEAISYLIKFDGGKKNSKRNLRKI